MKIRFLLVFQLVIILVFCGCFPDSKENQEITRMIYENLAAAQSEDVDRYLATIHEESPMYEPSIEMLSRLGKIYDLKYKLEDVRVLERTETIARVEFVQVTERLAGPDFKNNRVYGVHLLTKSNGKWKIFNTEVKQIEYF